MSEAMRFAGMTYAELADQLEAEAGGEGGMTRFRIPSFLPQRGWSIHTKGYVIYTSRKKGSLRRGISAHRAAMEFLLKRELTSEECIHHQDFNKRNNDPSNLILMCAALNPSGALRCPYTGQFLSPAQWERRFGVQRRAA